eukprot:5313848-Pleurochrysis_carterae.AAC.1
MWALAGTALRRKLLDEPPPRAMPSNVPLCETPMLQQPTAARHVPPAVMPTSMPSNNPAPSFASLFNIKWNPAAAIRPPQNHSAGNAASA